MKAAKHGGCGRYGEVGGVASWKSQPKLAWIAAAAAQAGTHWGSGQPWSGGQVSMSGPRPSTMPWRSALHDFSAGLSGVAPRSKIGPEVEEVEAELPVLALVSSGPPVSPVVGVSLPAVVAVGSLVVSGAVVGSPRPSP